MVALGGISLIIMLFVAIGLIATIAGVIIAVVITVNKKNNEKKLNQQIMAEQANMQLQQQPQDQSNPYMQTFNKVN